MSTPQPDVDQSEHARLWSRLVDDGTNIIWMGEVAPFRLLEVNEAGITLLGHPKNTLVGSDMWMQSIHANDQQRWHDTIAALEPGQTAHLLYRLVTPSRGSVPVCDNIRRVDDGEGPATVGGSAMVLPEELAQIESLTESRDLLLSLVEDIPMNIIRKDLNGRIVFANQRFCDSLKRPLSELIGKTDYDLFPADLARKYTSDDRRVIESGEPWEEIEAHEVTSGEQTYVQVLKSPVRDTEGAIIGLQVMFWDATARREAELQ